MIIDVYRAAYAAQCRMMNAKCRMQNDCVGSADDLNHFRREYHNSAFRAPHDKKAASGEAAFEDSSDY